MSSPQRSTVTATATPTATGMEMQLFTPSRRTTAPISSALVTSSRCTPPPVMAAPAPACVRCCRKTARFVTRSSNRNGNAGRPYYKCVPCNKFARFDDDRGNDDRNPPCDGCGHPSKRQIAGPYAIVPGGVHYVCSQGTCEFYQPLLNKNGVQLAINNQDLLKALIGLKLV